MAIILKANKVNLFVSSVLFVFWYHSPNVLDTPHIWSISRLRVKQKNANDNKKIIWEKYIVEVVVAYYVARSPYFRTRVE
jgi:hypothetical protein